jgi:hypothetical protein
MHGLVRIQANLIHPANLYILSLQEFLILDQSHSVNSVPHKFVVFFVHQFLAGLVLCSGILSIEFRRSNFCWLKLGSFVSFPSLLG